MYTTPHITSIHATPLVEGTQESYSYTATHASKDGDRSCGRAQGQPSNWVESLRGHNNNYWISCNVRVQQNAVPVRCQRSNAVRDRQQQLLFQLTWTGVHVNNCCIEVTITGAYQNDCKLQSKADTQNLRMYQHETKRHSQKANKDFISWCQRNSCLASHQNQVLVQQSQPLQLLH